LEVIREGWKKLSEKKKEEPKPKYPGGLKIAYEADAEKAKKKDKTQ
jgi:hypothetical protein